LFRIVLCVFIDPLHSNKHPIIARVGSRLNVFSKSLPSNGSIPHNIVTDVLKVFLGHDSVNMFQRATMEDVSVDECNSSLLGSSQRAKELVG
jgi:hypothetical protein